MQPPPDSLPDDAPLRDKVVDAIRRVYDPEIPVNIYDLGLIYDVAIDEQTKRVVVTMTLTTPNCPEADAIPGRVRQQIELLPEVQGAEVEMTWDPPWDKSRMSDEVKIMLGLE